MQKSIQTLEREYILQLANKYEKAGFLEEAADLYRKIQPSKSKKLYSDKAKKAEKLGLLIIAARMYGYADEEKKSVILWKRLSRNFDKKGLTNISRECAQYTRLEDPKNQKMRKLNLTAWNFLNSGELEKAKISFLKAAKFAEKNRWYKDAMRNYFHAGDYKNAEQLKKAFKNGGES